RGGGALLRAAAGAAGGGALPVPIVCSEVSAEDGEGADGFSEKAGSLDVDSAGPSGPVVVLESLVLTDHSSFGSASSVDDWSDSSEPRTSSCAVTPSDAPCAEISPPSSPPGSADAAGSV